MHRAEKKRNIPDLLRKMIEISRPDFRDFYRVVRKARIVAVYPSDGKYYADVQPLRNDESPDPDEPVIPKVPVPVIWAGPQRGVVCPPAEGSYCDLSYYDGDPNYPFISNFRWYAMQAPEAALNEFVIQLEPGVEMRIDKEKKIIALTSADIESKAGKNWIIQAGDKASITAGSEASVQAQTVTLSASTIRVEGDQTSIIAKSNATVQAQTVTLSASTVKLEASITMSGKGGSKTSATLDGSFNVRGTITADRFYTRD